MKTLQFGLLAPRMRREWDAWCEDRRGAAAVEFAIIAIPFFFLIFGLLEVCLLFIISTVLEHSISETSRQIRTGQAQESGFTDVEFRQAICAQLFDLLDVTPYGRQESWEDSPPGWPQQPPYEWIRLHDAY